MSFTLTRGRLPLLISFPHSGTHIPADIRDTLTEHARQLPDTDWHVPALYSFARRLGAWTLEAHVSRYVIDLNRDPADRSLYPGQSTTSLCPIDTFDGRPVYRDGMAPDNDAIARRIATHWQPYHRALRDTLATLRAQHGGAALYDAHSIRSQVPRFFDGTLPDLNLGTARGASAADSVRAALIAELSDASWSVAVDGRFVGGYITRHYGDPTRGVHAVQMEIAQSAYMDEDRRDLQPLKARALAALLERVCVALVNTCTPPSESR